MRLARQTRHTRRGAAAPLVALLLIPLLGMAAFSIDVGYMIVVRTELQNAADAAAMAAAEQLMQPYVQYYTVANASNQPNIYANALAMAKATAKAVSQCNTAGGVNIRLQDLDVVVGYYDGTAFTPSPSDWTSGQTFPNSVLVTARRDGTGDANTTNGAVPLFFGRVFGPASTDQQAFAQATTYTVQSVTSFQDVSSLRVGMLPATFDVAVWRQFIQTGSIAGVGGQFAGAAVAPDGNGNNMLQVYQSNKSVGNFGVLPINGVNTGDVKSQVTSGMTQSMYETLLSQNGNTSTPLIPLAPFDMSTLQPVGGTAPAGTHDPSLAPSSTNANGPTGAWNWTGQSGFIASNASEINNYPGVYLLPLFRAVDDGQGRGAGNSLTGSPFSSTNYQAGIGQGSNYYYNIVDFVAIQIMPVQNQTNRNVFVEPAAMVLTFDQVVGTPPTIVGPPTTGTLNTIFVAPRLTR